MDSLLSDLREYEGGAASREEGDAEITWPASQLPSSREEGSWDAGNGAARRSSRSSRAASRSSLPAPKSEVDAAGFASGSRRRPYGSESKESGAHPRSDVSLSFSTDLHPESNTAGDGASSRPFPSDGFTAQPIAHSTAHSAGSTGAGAWRDAAVVGAGGTGAGSSMDAASAPAPMFPGRAPPPAHAPSSPAFERAAPKGSLPASYSGGAAGVSPSTLNSQP